MEKIRNLLMTLALAFALAVWGFVFCNVEKVDKTDYGVMINFKDGTGYWIEKGLE